MASPSTQAPAKRIALITGANSGVGYGIARRLLNSCKLVLACRNLSKAKDARRRLLLGGGRSGDVELLHVDLSSVKSVVEACREFDRRFDRLDLLFCNAGILLNDGFSVKSALYALLTDPVAFFTDAGDSLVQPIGAVTEDGLGAVFAANVFGHYLMVRRPALFLPAVLGRFSDLEGAESTKSNAWSAPAKVTLLEKKLAAAAAGGRVIWTSSFTAKRKHFSIDDYQHIKGPRAYESSKFAIDILSVGISQRFVDSSITSFTISPGTLHTNIVTGLGLLDWVISPMFYMARALGIPQLTIEAWTAAEAHVYCANMPTSLLSPKLKYNSMATRLGKPYVDMTEIDFEEEEPAKLEALLRQAASEVLASDFCKKSVKNQR